MIYQGEVEALVERLVTRGYKQKPTGVAGAEFRKEVRQLAERGELWAVRLIDQREHDSFRRLWTTIVRRSKWDVMVSYTKQVVSVRQSYARRRRRNDGTATREYQLAMIETMTWEDAEAVAIELRGQRNRLDAAVLFWQAVLNLRQEFPAARTPLHALQLAGIDLNQEMVVGLL